MILVLGATGLLGTELIKQLAKDGKMVKALYRNTSPTFLHPTINWIEGDIMDVVFLDNLISSVDLVYNCAGLISFSPKQRDLLYKINVEGTSNIVNACLNNNIKKLIHVSSVASLGRASNTEIINEKTIWNNSEKNSEYAKSKHHGEIEVWRGIAEGLNSVIVNPSIILGAGDWKAGSTKIFKTIYDNFEWYSTGINGFVDVQDVAKAMIYLMESSITNQRFILNADNLEYKKIFESIATIWNKKLPHKQITPFLAGIRWRIEKVKAIFSKQEPLITRETVNTAMEQYFYNNNKLLNELPEFSYQSMDITLKRICKELEVKYKLS